MAITIHDIGRETGFHPSTVSQVLSGNKHCYASAKTRRLIIETAQRLNFVPNHFARSLQRQRSYTIGVLVGCLGGTASGPQFTAINEALSGRGYTPLFCETRGEIKREERALQELRYQQVEGVILETPNDDAILKPIIPQQFPCVMIRPVASPGFPCVVTDRAAALENGVQWLADRGHKRIACVAGERSANTSLRKVVGYRRAMERLGLFDEALVMESGLTSGATREFVSQHGDFFKTVTAVLTSNDRIAIEVMSELVELGMRVPEDCSVIGFDDTEFAIAVRPKLTTFRPLRREIGAHAVTMIFDLIDGQKVESVNLVPELIVRESAGPCRRTRLKESTGSLSSSGKGDAVR